MDVLGSVQLKAVRDLPLLSEEEFQALIKKRDEGDKEAVHTIAIHNLRLGYSQVAKTISQMSYKRIGDVDADDIWQEVYLSLVEAAKAYDPSLKGKFSTYAYHFIGNKCFTILHQWRKHARSHPGPALDREEMIHREPMQGMMSDEVDEKTDTDRLYDELEALCLASGSDAFINRVKLAISGNMIDYGVNPDFDLGCAEKHIREVLELPYDAAALDDLKCRIEKAENILYILDNCGEAVLDRLLLETMKDKVTIGVRGKPIINDITRKELADSALDDFPVIDTGCNAPGAPLRMISPEFRDKMESADLVIAKGQGNFESLEGFFTAKPIYFLFRAKCPVIQKYLDVSFGSLQIQGRNLTVR